MRRLVFLVEGISEVKFINNKIIPYLYNRGFTSTMHAQTVLTNRVKFTKGGIQSYNLFRNDLSRILAQGDVIVTSMIDFFKLPNDFPNYTNDYRQVQDIEAGIADNLGNPEGLIPYIQLHELEGLLFVNEGAFQILGFDGVQMDTIRDVIANYPNPELINGGIHSAPSKRLKQIFQYDKSFHSELLFESISVEEIIERCPRFANWINQIIVELSRAS
jgi:hypothetical protein